MMDGQMTIWDWLDQERKKPCPYIETCNTYGIGCKGILPGGDYSWGNRGSFERNTGRIGRWAYYIHGSA